MFAKPRMTVTLRVFLMVVICFNTLAPTFALAKSLPSSDFLGSLENQLVWKSDRVSLAQSNYLQRFARPTPATVKKASQSQDSLAQTSSVLLQCVDTENCSDRTPGVTLTQIIDQRFVNGGDDRSIDFKILCEGSSCTKRKIYYSVTMEVEWGNGISNPPLLEYASLDTSPRGSGGFVKVPCGTGLEGSCSLATSGVIPAISISPDPTDNSHFSIKNTGGTSAAWEWGHRVLNIQVSLDPSLLDSAVPDESSNCKGCPYAYKDATGWAADPINTRTGALSYSANDLEISTGAGPLSFRRTYISPLTNGFTSPLGYGWVHNQDIRLIFPSSNESEFVHFKDPSGNLYRFRYTDTGYYISYAGNTATLTQQGVPAVTYTLTDQSQNVYIFDQTGRVKSVENAARQMLIYTYVNGQLSRVSYDATHYLEFHYDPANPDRLKSVNDQTERSVTYYYDSNGDLDYFDDVLGQRWHYTYDNHLLTEILDKNLDPVQRNEYYPDGRAKKQFEGDNIKPIVELTYNPDGTTTVKDANGISRTHAYDSAGTLTGDINQYGGNTTKVYDSNFRPISIIDPDIEDPNKRTTSLDWSEDGANLTYIKDTLGGQTSIKYEDPKRYIEPKRLNNPTEIIDPLDNKTTYAYEDVYFPTLPTEIKTVDKNEDLVSSTGYDYYPSGASAGKVELVTELVTETSEYKTHYTYTASGQPDIVITAYDTPKAQTTDYDYDDLGRLIKVTDPAGVITRNQYDDAGRLTVTINNVYPGHSNDENPPQNYLEGYGNIFNLYTRYYYDVRGNQIAMVDTDWNITRTYYDLANRPIMVVQNLVVNGTPATDERSAIAAINTNIGDGPYFDPYYSDRNMTTKTEYDDAGNVIIVRDPLGIITRTYYDPTNRRELVIQNWSGNALYGPISSAPEYDPSHPDRNIRTETFFDANGNAIATKDTLGVITRTYYDEHNRPEIIIKNWSGMQIDNPFAPERTNPPDPEYHLRTDLYYDANGNQIATQDPNGVVTRTYYDGLSRPRLVVQNWAGSNVYTDPAPDRSQCGEEINVCSETFYDLAGNVIRTVDPRGVPTRTYYDAANRPERILQNEGGAADEIRQTEIKYDANGRRERTIDTLGHITKYKYNHMGQLIEEIVNYLDNDDRHGDTFNIYTRFTYDALGRQLTQEDALQRVTLNEYDALGRLKSVTKNFRYGEGVNIKTLSTGDQFNIMTRYVYDQQGNQIAQIEVEDDSGNGLVTRTYFDALGRPTTVTRNLQGMMIENPWPWSREMPEPDPLKNIRTDTVYLGNGNVDYVVDEMGKSTDYEYDTVGRLVRMTDPRWNQTRFAYDANGNRILVIDGEDIVTKYEYDHFNRLTDVIENYVPNQPRNYQTNVRTSYTYDAGGNRLSIRDGNSNLPNAADYRTTFTYDPLGRVKSETDPLGYATLYTYSHNARGNLVSIQDPMLKTTVYHYDEMDRLYWIEYPVPDEGWAFAIDAEFSYDALGRRTSASNRVEDIDWEYNNLDLPVTIQSSNGSKLSYEYDLRGNRSTLDLNYGEQHIVYEYNVLDQIESVRGTGIDGMVEYQYDAAGHLKTVSRPNDLDTLYTYFENGWLKEITHSSQTLANNVPRPSPSEYTSTLASYRYEYYGNGNRKQAIEDIILPWLPPTPTPTLTPSITPTSTLTLTPSVTPTSTVTSTPTNTPTGAQIDTFIAGTKRGSDFVGNNTVQRKSYAGLNTGPVKTLSTNNVPMIVSQGATYKVNGVNTSYSEMMGLPDSQLDTTYWIPWYNNVDADSQLRFANVSDSTATIHVYIGGEEMTGSPFTLTAGASIRKSYTGINKGPVKIVSDVEIVAAKRVIYDVNDVDVSYSETMALPASQLDTTYWLPWYNNVELDTQLQIGNASSSTATVHVYIAGVEMTGSPFTIPANTSTRKSFANINGGRVQIVSNVPIVVAERVIEAVNGVNVSYSEMMALPNNQLDTTYWLSGYDNVNLDSQLRFANVSDSNATVHVYVGSAEVTGSPFNLVAGASTRKSFAGVNGGPVKIVSNVPIVTAKRIIYKVNGVDTSYSEIMGLPNSQLDTTFWMPWYNNVDLNSELILAVGGNTPSGDQGFTGMNNQSRVAFESDFAVPVGKAIPANQDPKQNWFMRLVSYVLPAPLAQVSETDTPTVTPTATQTETPIGTPIASLSPTAAATPSATATQTPGGTPTTSATSSAIFTPTATQTSIPAGPLTIDYVYDPLNRLIEANYSNGDYYHYGDYTEDDGDGTVDGFDAMGNRLWQEIRLNGVISNTTYTYDDANRLTSVNGVAYDFDDNGNLRSDGVNTYDYDGANRLTSITGSSISATYTYNGLGDRLQETLNEQTTTFTMDYGANLTQALSDGTHHYIYGVDRIAQTQGGETEYFLGDALGSVRQLASSSAITYTRAYDPYGVVTNTLGSSQSAFGYTSEYSGDYNELLYLRARFYAPGTGRFLTKDPSGAEANLYLYASANPINRSDPTGLQSGWDGLSSFVACFDLHSLSHGVYSSDGVVTYATVDDVIDICRRAYSKDAWNPQWFDFSKTPESAHDLMGWYLYEQGDEHMWFDGDSALTKELARSTLISDIRLKYYLQGDLTGQNLKEFGYASFIRSLSADSRLTSDLSLPISFFLGSFKYQVITLGNRVGFRIDNRTDLESGTHIAGRFPGEEYGGSIEELLTSGDISGGDLLFNVMNQKFYGKKVISILRPQRRTQTSNPLGGGNMEQTYTWTEPRSRCTFMVLLENYIPLPEPKSEDAPGFSQIQPWPNYQSYTSEVTWP